MHLFSGELPLLQQRFYVNLLYDEDRDKMHIKSVVSGEQIRKEQGVYKLLE